MIKDINDRPSIVIQKGFRTLAINEFEYLNGKKVDAVALSTGAGIFLSYEDTEKLIKGLQNFLANVTSQIIDDSNLSIIKENEEDEIIREDIYARESKKHIAKNGYIYFILDQVGNCKIGKAKNMKNRMGEYTKLPHKPTLHHYLYSSDIDECEKIFHEKFKEKRLRGEWFKLDGKDLSYIKNKGYMNDLDIQCYVMENDIEENYYKLLMG